MKNFSRFEEVLQNEETATECYYLVIDDQEINEKKYKIGEFYYLWKREDMISLKESKEQKKKPKYVNGMRVEDEESEEERKFYVTTKVAVPEITIEKFPLYIETVLPAYGTLESNFTVINKIKNNSNRLLNLECKIDDNLYFSIGGNKLVY